MYRDGGVIYITSILILTEIYIILFYCPNREWILLRRYFFFKTVSYNETCIGGSRRGVTGVATPLKIQKLKKSDKAKQKKKTEEMKREKEK